MAELPRVALSILNNDHYQSWKYKLKLLLIKEGLWDAISNSTPASSDAMLLQKDGKTKAIGLFVEDNPLIHIRTAENAKAAWLTLEEYRQKSSLSNKVFLLKRLCRLKLKENENLEEHINSMIEIQDRLATGQGATSIAKHFGLHEATVRTIKKNEAAIRKSVCSGTKLSANPSSYTGDIVKEKMAKTLVIWIEDKSQKRVSVDGNAINRTAFRMYTQIKEMEPGTSSELNEKYEFSANESATKKFPLKLAKIIEDGGYIPDQVWNADEGDLFWERMPNRTYVAEAQKRDSGFKVAKDRVTLFCSNASGDYMSLVNRALKPRSMKGVDLNKLSVHWMANKKAWVTIDIYTEWFNKCFDPKVGRYMNINGLDVVFDTTLRMGFFHVPATLFYFVYIQQYLLFHPKISNLILNPPALFW
ncbi:PREDICTED: tigger transposable element-derived protein 1-like [Eufriesea mexicana]|uniref:tigger transposable element-derived protein 1-like n=1 Tax=Eufriesea mexicana TaxID=516756 RepID=UPI00083C5B38|nr:PREDICTED: tigger transposable element-derived protein 1-like [Eufriesea mexicana]